MSRFPLVIREEVMSFSDAEYDELNKYIQSGKGFNLGVSIANTFFNLYVHGTSIDEICRRYSEFPRGAILLARWKYDWDRKKYNYAMDLQDKMLEKWKVTKVEALDHLCNTLNVLHQEFEMEMSEYLRDPKNKPLPKNRIRNVHELQTTIKAINDLVNVGKVEDVQKPAVSVNVNVGEVAAVEKVVSEDGLSGDKRKKILQILVEE